MLPKTSAAYVKSDDGELNGGLFCLKFNKASNSIKTEFDSEPI